jgi:acyl carrier protein
MTEQSEHKLGDVFRAVMNLESGTDVSALRQLSTPGWDSLAHVSLVAAIESEFGIAIDIEDSLELTSYQAVKLFLEERVT